MYTDENLGDNEFLNESKRKIMILCQNEKCAQLKGTKRALASLYMLNCN